MSHLMSIGAVWQHSKISFLWKQGICDQELQYPLRAAFVILSNSVASPMSA